MTQQKFNLRHQQNILPLGAAGLEKNFLFYFYCSALYHVVSSLNSVRNNL